MARAKDKKTGLTQQQEAFCQNILKGMTQYEAYKEAYNVTTTDRDTTDNDAYKLAQKPEIITRLTQLKDTLEKKTLDKIEYTREMSFKVFDENITGLKKRLEEVLADPDLTQKDKAYLENMLRKNIKEQEEMKAKLWSLFVEKKEVDIKGSFLSVSLSEERLLEILNPKKTIN